MNKAKFVVLLLASFCSHAIAGPADYVYTPIVEYRESELDFKFGTAEEQDGTRENVASLGYGYGATEYWFTEVYFKRETAGNETLNLAEWENKFQLTETGKYPLDLGLIVELEVPLNISGPTEFKFGPLFQTDFNKVQVNVNLLFERLFGYEEADDPHITEMAYQWQLKYRWQQAFEYGLQGFGEMGEWDNWEAADEQSHKLGPAIFGKFAVGGKHAFKYNAAMLFGISDVAPDLTFRMQAEYEF